MEFPWFKRRGFLFFPKNIMGWVIVMLALGYAVYLFIDIDSHSHSVSDTLISFIFNLAILWVIYSVLALLTSKTAGTNETE